MRLKTPYEIEQIPHAEHPRPQAERKTWLCLNGSWRLQKRKAQGELLDMGEILVPFSPETLRSGVAEGFVLERGEKLIYEREFLLTKDLLLGKTLLHFGAVDSECTVFVNGERTGSHRGGFTAFSLDITAFICEGANRVRVECADEAVWNGSARGKQSEKPGGIWYTRQSGIWQTVWLESMPKKYIADLKIYPDAAKKEVRIASYCGGAAQEIVVYDGEREILRKKYDKEVLLSYNFELWSPEKPKLYDFVVTSETGDEVKSYFGVRSFGKKRDENGIMRLTLNGEPYFFNGVLDQGYWSDGLLTYPCDRAAVDELETLKAMGFNTVRKHIKIEPMRWYYHCDRLGLVVWQDFVNGGGAYKFMHVAALPFLGFHHRDDDYAYFGREDAFAREEFLHACEETVEQLFNCVSIGVWVPFNEGWGQFDSAQVTEWLRGKDGSRIIDSVSGWHDQGVGKTELKSLHTYYTPLKVPKDERAVVLSEFGGYSLKTDGHVFNPNKEFGYKKFKDKQSLAAAIEKLYLTKLLPLIEKGLCGCIYTQVSDVEEEINGLFTYDRQVLKVEISTMRAVNKQIAAEAKRVFRA